MSATLANRIMALARVMRPSAIEVGDDRSDVPIRRNVIGQLRQHGRIANIAGRDLDATTLRCLLVGSLLVDPDVHPAPDTPSGAAMPAGVPFPFARSPDARAVDEEG